MKKKTKEKKGVMALNLDTSKAYDRIEWDFTIKTLEMIGFLEGMVKLIKICIEIVFYGILINGKLSKEFFPIGDSVKKAHSLITCLLLVQMFYQEYSEGKQETQTSME